MSTSFNMNNINILLNESAKFKVCKKVLNLFVVLRKIIVV